MHTWLTMNQIYSRCNVGVQCVQLLPLESFDFPPICVKKPKCHSVYILLPLLIDENNWFIITMG